MIQIPPRAISIIQGYEGISGRAKDNRFYPVHEGADDAKVLTIGRGHVVKPGEDFSRGLTLVEVNKLFEQDCQPRAFALAKIFENGMKVHEYWTHRKYEEYEFAGALSGFFNIEEPWTPGHPVHDLFFAGKKVEAMRHLLLYVNSNHQKQQGLIRRRATEALCILTGSVVIAKDMPTEHIVCSRLRGFKIDPYNPMNMNFS